MATLSKAYNKRAVKTDIALEIMHCLRAYYCETKRQAAAKLCDLQAHWRYRCRINLSNTCQQLHGLLQPK